MTVNVVFLIVAVVVATILFRVLRSGQLREKYAALWIVLGAVIVILGVWPDLLQRVAQLLGVQLASNLLFFLAVLLLFGVALHLSMAVSKLEEEARTLAEEMAILRLDFDESQRRTGARAEASSDLAPGSRSSDEAPPGSPGDLHESG